MCPGPEKTPDIPKDAAKAKMDALMKKEAHESHQPLTSEAVVKQLEAKGMKVVKVDGVPQVFSMDLVSDSGIRKKVKEIKENAEKSGKLEHGTFLTARREVKEGETAAQAQEKSFNFHSLVYIHDASQQGLENGGFVALVETPEKIVSQTEGKGTTTEAGPGVEVKEFDQNDLEKKFGTLLTLRPNEIKNIPATAMEEIKSQMAAMKKGNESYREITAGGLRYVAAYPNTLYLVYKQGNEKTSVSKEILQQRLGHILLDTKIDDIPAIRGKKEVSHQMALVREGKGLGKEGAGQSDWKESDWKEGAFAEFDVRSITYVYAYPDKLYIKGDYITPKETETERGNNRWDTPEIKQ